MAYTEYPNNSLNARSQQTPQNDIQKPKMTAVAKAQKRPKTFWRKTADEFFGNNPDDGKTIGEHIWFDAFIPFVKNGIVETITRILFGDSYVPRPGMFNGIVDKRPGAASRIGYSSISTGQAQQQQAQQRMAYDYEELEFSSRGDADSVLERMFELIDSPYGRVTVGDLYDISEVSPGPYTNCNYGWTQLNGAHVVRNYNGTFSLSLPKPKPLK